jgi:hypothetical protein
MGAGLPGAAIEIPQYRAAPVKRARTRALGVPLNSTRKAISFDKLSWLKSPGLMRSDKPDCAAPCCGKPQSGFANAETAEQQQRQRQRLQQ